MFSLHQAKWRPKVDMPDSPKDGAPCYTSQEHATCFFFVLLPVLDVISAKEGLGMDPFLPDICLISGLDFYVGDSMILQALLFCLSKKSSTIMQTSHDKGSISHVNPANLRSSLQSDPLVDPLETQRVQPSFTAPSSLTMESQHSPH